MSYTVVRQPLESCGCGIAAVACVIKKTYPGTLKRAKKIIPNWPRWVDKKTNKDLYFTNAKDLKILLSSYRIKTSKTIYTKSWIDIPNLAVVNIKYYNGAGHWVVFVRDSAGARFYDSYPCVSFGMPRTDFWRINPYAYFEVKK